MTPHEELNLLGKLVSDLIRREAHPGEIHICPICGGSLHVYFTAHRDEVQKTRRFAVGARCDRCETKAFFHYGFIPPWVEIDKREEPPRSLSDMLRELKELSSKKRE